MAENWKHFYEQTKKMLSMYQDEIVPGFREQIEKLENNRVEVVRCRDCIYYETGKDYLPYCNCDDGGIADYPRENDFCSYGERKDDGQS